ncbi:MAG: histidine phosphatase family protein [Blautia sp.]|jgi:broad specificity phosphatase PhoE
MLLYIIRHGETDWNVQRRLQGEQDNPLNDSGRKLAELTAWAFRDINVDLVITSPLSRAVETAQIVLGYREIPYFTDSRLREIDWGEWDGIQAGSPEYESIFHEMKLFYEHPFEFQGSPTGESIQEVCRRTKEFLKELVENEDYQDKTVLISTHGCAMRGLLNSLYEDPQDFWQQGVPANCAVSIVRAEKGRMSFVEREKIFYDKSLQTDFYRLD